jgi:hypothetical protein
MNRTPLGEISTNIRRGIKLTLSIRSRIYGAHDFSVRIAEIARRYEILESTVRSTVELEPICYGQVVQVAAWKPNDQ